MARSPLSLTHGSIRFSWISASPALVCVVPREGGGMLLPNKSNGAMELHRIPELRIWDLDDCIIDGKPHQKCQWHRTYWVYMYDDGPDGEELEFSLIKHGGINGYECKSTDARKMLIGWCRRLDNGALGYGGWTCTCVSFFKPNLGDIVINVGGTATVPNEWRVPEQSQRIGFIGIGDGREPAITFAGQVAGSLAGTDVECAIFKNLPPPPFVPNDAYRDSFLGGGFIHQAHRRIQACCVGIGAGINEQADPPWDAWYEYCVSIRTLVPSHLSHQPAEAYFPEAGRLSVHIAA